MDRIAELAEAVAIGAALPQENDDYLIAALTGRLVAAEVAGPDENESLTAAVAVARASGGQAAPRTIRLPLSLIDQLMNGVSDMRSEEHTSELQSLMRISYAVF